MTDDGSGPAGYRVHFPEPHAKPLVVDDEVPGGDVVAHVEETYSMWEVELGRPDDEYTRWILVAAEGPEDAERRARAHVSDGETVSPQSDPEPHGGPLVESVAPIDGEA